MGRGDMAGQAAPNGGTAERDLLLFSDIHLGSDLKRRALRQAGSLEALCREDGLDRAIGGLLDHYTARTPVGGSWRLVLAGDVVDFIGINLTPRDVGGPATFEPTVDEMEYGLEPGPERCAWLFDLVVRRHPLFFERLGAFVARGHELVVIRGNHDAALHWPEVQTAFSEALAAGALRAGCDADVVAEMPRVRFEDWFYLEPGRIFVEHGHLHDELCADPGARMVETDRPNRLRLPVTALILRYFANRFPSLDLDEVDQWTAGQYLRWALLVENPLRIVLAFAQTLAMLTLPFLRKWRRQLRRERAHAGRDAVLLDAASTGSDGDDDMAPVPELAVRARARLSQAHANAERLVEGLAHLVRRAGRVTFLGILRMFYLDRAVTMGGGIALSASCVALGVPWLAKGPVAAVVLLAAILVDRRMVATRGVAIGPKLRKAADEVSRLCDVPLIVMGHSHKQVDIVLSDARTRYVNLGSWLGARGGQWTHGFPHLVVRGSIAELLRWRGACEA